MATLTNTRIKNTYDGLLKTTDNDALGGTYKLITDGLGNSSNIYLGTGGNLGIGIIPTEKFHVNGDAIVSGDLHVDAIKPIASSNPIKFKNFASTELVRITDSGNVGIGETDPSKPLTINKNQSETAILVQSSDTGLSGIYLGGQSDSIKGGLILDNSDNSLQLRGYNNANRLHIDSSGNVGIGTTSPGTFKLDVAGSARSNFFALRLNQSLPSESSAIYRPATGTFAIVTSAAERMRIDANGVVQVRNQIPTIQLYNTDTSLVSQQTLGDLDWYQSDASGSGANVVGKIRGVNESNFQGQGALSFHTGISGGSGEFGVVERMRIESSGLVTIKSINNSVTFDRYFQTRNALISGYSGTNEAKLYLHRDDVTISSGNVLGELNFSGADGGSLVGANIQGVAAGSWGSTSCHSNLVFKTAASGSTSASERMRIDSSGNVGIGTTNPVDKFQIDAANSQLRLRDTDDGSYTQFSSSGDKLAIRQSSTSANHIWLTSTGNVGIGTSNPSTKLHVYESNSLDHITIDGNNGDNRNLRFATENSTRWNLYASGTSETGSNVGSDLTIAKYTDAGVYNGNVLMIKRNTGNVGIGTGSPDVNFQVGDGTTDTVSRFYFNDNTYTQINGYGLYMSRDSSYIRPTTDNTKILYIGANTKQWNVLSMDASATLFNTNGSENMRITATGNVGIGTGANVDEKLHIQGSVDNDDVALKIENTFDDNSSSTPPSAAVVFSTASNNGHIRVFGAPANTAANHKIDIGSTAASSYLTFSPSGSERMRIDANGNVGIGTTSPIGNFNIFGGTGDTTTQDVVQTFTRTSSTGNVLAAKLRLVEGTSTTHGDLKFQVKTTASSAENPIYYTDAITIKGNTGNVGIGTTSPLANLHVYSGGKAAIIRSTQNVGLEVQGGNNGTDIAIFKNTSGTEKFSLDTNGQMFNLGMASSSSANASLMHNSSTGLIYRYTSSIRYKEDVKDLTNAVDKIMKLRPVEFKPKDSLKYTTGMIAEEVFEVMPEITFEAEIEGFDEPQVDGISYEPMHAYYIKAIQEQQEMINELKSDIETLKSQINS